MPCRLWCWSQAEIYFTLAELARMQVESRDELGKQSEITSISSSKEQSLANRTASQISNLDFWGRRVLIKGAFDLALYVPCGKFPSLKVASTEASAAPRSSYEFELGNFAALPQQADWGSWARRLSCSSRKRYAGWSTYKFS